MIKRGQQILYGTAIIALGGYVLVGPIIRLEEQPSTWLMVVAAGLIVVGLWLVFPVGMGEFGDWLAAKLPWLEHHPEGDDDAA